MRKGHIQGYLYVLIAAALWGASSIVAKSLFNIGLPPVEPVLVRLTLAALALFLILLLSDRKRMVIDVRDLPYFFILGLVGVAGMQFPYYYAMSQIHVALAILLQYLQPVWVSVYAFLFQKEPLTRGKATALILSFAGCYFVMGGPRIDILRSNVLGMLSGVAASIFFAFYALWGEKGLKRYDPWTLILYGFAFGSLFYWILVPPTWIVSEGHSLNVWLAFVYIAIFSTLIPYGFYFKGMERIRATRASITATLEPVVAGFTAYFVLGEILHPVQVLGGIGVIAAVVLLQITRERSGLFSPLEIRSKESSEL